MICRFFIFFSIFVCDQSHQCDAFVSKIFSGIKYVKSLIDKGASFYSKASSAFSKASGLIGSVGGKVAGTISEIKAALQGLPGAAAALGTASRKIVDGIENPKAPDVVVVTDPETKKILQSGFKEVTEKLELLKSALQEVHKQFENFLEEIRAKSISFRYKQEYTAYLDTLEMNYNEILRNPAKIQVTWFLQACTASGQNPADIRTRLHHEIINDPFQPKLAEILSKQSKDRSQLMKHISMFLGDMARAIIMEQLCLGVAKKSREEMYFSEASGKQQMHEVQEKLQTLYNVKFFEWWSQDAIPSVQASAVVTAEKAHDNLTINYPFAKWFTITFNSFSKVLVSGSLKQFLIKNVTFEQEMKSIYVAWCELQWGHFSRKSMNEMLLDKADLDFKSLTERCRRFAGNNIEKAAEFYTKWSSSFSTATSSIIFETGSGTDTFFGESECTRVYNDFCGSKFTCVLTF